MRPNPLTSTGIANVSEGPILRLRPLLLLALLLCLGCATPVGVKRVSPEAAYRNLQVSALAGNGLSAASMQLLYRLALFDRWKSDPTGVLADLRAGLDKPDQSDRLFGLSELSYAHGADSGDNAYFRAAAVYAWAFLFPADPLRAPDATDPRLRRALDLYNRGLERGLASGQGNQIDLSERRVALPFGWLDLSKHASEFRYAGYWLVDFISLGDYEPRGLRNDYHRAGIGGSVVSRVTATEEGTTNRWIPPNAKVPTSLLVRFDDALAGIESGEVRGEIEIYDPDQTPAVKIGDKQLPLEFETTAALAYRLEGAPLWDFDIAGFRRGDFSLVAGKGSTGLLMLYPYRPGRIPLVFVHGTASSPARWAEMANEILGDPVLGARYQLWFFIYNTGNPVAFSAMRLREALQAAVADLDPEGRDAALHEMIVVGHSQGGLLTKMTAVESGSKFWDAFTEDSFEEAKLTPETRDLAQRALFIEPLPFVHRLIFIATPHRGSFLTQNFLGNLARKLVNLPASLTHASVELITLRPRQALNSVVTVPTSIDNMNGSNPFLKTLASLPVADGVKVNSIVAVRGDGPPELGDDGVVAYESAHLDGVESELVVRSGHSTQAEPATIEEVRRILYQNLAEVEAKSAPPGLDAASADPAP